MNAFVLVVCGENHIPWAERAVKHIQYHTNNDIIIVASRISRKFHDNIIKVKLPDLDNLLASRHLKASLSEIIKPSPGDVCCYVDSDILFVHDDASEVFSHMVQPISFATDHIATVSRFSPWAVKTGDLYNNIRDDFGVGVNVGWSLWNGGMFLFSNQSHGFLDLWRNNIHKVFESNKWHKRDQGALIAAVWKMGLQNHPRIPKEFNWIVDHTNIDVEGGNVDFDGKNFTANGSIIKAMHFIHKEKHPILNTVLEKYNDH